MFILSDKDEMLPIYRFALAPHERRYILKFIHQWCAIYYNLEISPYLRIYYRSLKIYYIEKVLQFKA